MGDGTADASINNSSVYIKLAVSYTDGQINCKIQDSAVVLNQFDVVVHGSKASSAYNLLIALFRERVRLIVQDTLTTNLAEKVSTLTDSINGLVGDSFKFLESEAANKYLEAVPDNIVENTISSIISGDQESNMELSEPAPGDAE